MADPIGGANDIELQALLKSYPSFLQSPTDIQTGKKVLDILCKSLLGKGYTQTVSPVYPDLTLYYSTERSVTLGVLPLDFYAWNLWTSDDSIACCVTGTPSEDTFYRLARSRLRDESGAITIERSDKSEATFNLQILTTKIQLRYHPNPLISRWSNITKQDIVEIERNLPWRSQERFDELGRSQDVANQLKGFQGPITCHSYFLYKQWATNLGLYGTILSKEHLLGLARYALYARVGSHVLSTLDLPLPEEPVDIAKTCQEIGLHGIRIKPPAWQTMTCLVRMAREELHQNGHSPIMNFKVSQWPLYFHLWDRFIRIDASYWGSSSVTASKYLQAVERTVRLGLLRELQKSQPQHAFHFWPQAFCDTNNRVDRRIQSPTSPPPLLFEIYPQLLRVGSTNKVENQTEHDAKVAPAFNLCYFIGYKDPSSSVDEKTLSEEFVSDTFYRALDWDDTSSCSTQVTKVRRDQLRNAIVPYTPYPIAIPEDVRKLALEDEEEAAANNAETPVSPPSKAPPKKSKQHKARRREKSESSEDADQRSQQEAKRPYLRPASDVLHRIRHDSSFNTDDFLIGYLDRHAGVKEIPFDWWTVEKTAEEFIPQSRIRYFKRKSDGSVLWNREARIDLVFGTGK